MAAVLRRAPSAPQTGQAVFIPPSVQGAVQVQTASSGPVSPKASVSAASALIGSSDRHRAKASKAAKIRRFRKVMGFSFLAWAECLFPLESPTGKEAYASFAAWGCFSALQCTGVLGFLQGVFPLPRGKMGQKSCTKCPGRLGAARGWGSYTVGSSMGAKPPLGITKISCRPGASSLKRAKPPRTRKLRMSSSASV